MVFVAVNGETVTQSANGHHVTKDQDLKVCNNKVQYTNDYIEADYEYHNTDVQEIGGIFHVTPRVTCMKLRTERKVPRLGLMMVGWGGNNGSTVTATILANRTKLSWNTKDGVKHANYLGSLTQSATVSLGINSTTGEEVYVPMKDMLPMVNPNDLAIDGWDISSLNMAECMARAKVLDWEVQQQLFEQMKNMKPRPGIYDLDFIAANQEERADNIIPGTKWEQVERIRKDIQDFKQTSKVDKVVIVWTANTERFCRIDKGLNDSADNLLASIKANKTEIAPSTLYAVAAILEGCSYLNGSPQNTFVPGCLELAELHGVFVGGDDFKSGQTKLKSVLIDFLIGAGIKPCSIVSYNHLGNNDGKNLSAAAQFRSKEISKSNIVDDMVASNKIMYKPGEMPDHCVVIKHVPYVGDSKRALDEYTSEIMMGGHNTLVIHNTCEDSLLASPIILDLALLTELCQRIQFKLEDHESYQSFHSILSILSYLCKAPLVPPGAPIVNALFKQRACIENVLRACIGLGPVHHMGLEKKLNNVKIFKQSTKDEKNGKLCLKPVSVI